MAGEFLSGLQVGANIGNMRAMRAERMMELKAQEAYRALQERQINAQVEMAMQHAKYYEAQAINENNLKIRKDAVAKAIGDVYDQNFQSTQDERAALLATIPAAARIDPDAGVRMSQIYENVLQGEKNTQADSQFQGTVYQPIDESTGQPAIDPETGKPIRMVTTSKSGSTLLDAKTKPGELSVVGKEEIKSLYKEIDRLKEQYDTMDDTTGIGYFKKPNEKKQNLKTRIDVLRQEAKSLEASSPKSKEHPDKFVVGKLYQDANGNKARYLGNGQWEEVK